MAAVLERITDEHGGDREQANGGQQVRRDTPGISG
jgi:hypothetical protein